MTLESWTHSKLTLRERLNQENVGHLGLNLPQGCFYEAQQDAGGAQA